MPLIVLLGALFAAACIVAATEDDDLIVWSKDRKLTRTDFKGTSPMPGGIAARSFIAIKASWVCDNDRFEPDIRAVFVPSRSTWSKSMRSGFDASNARPMALNEADTLQHEQTHFDIAEVVARKIRRHFAALTEICTRTAGMVPLAAVVEDYQNELDEEQARYDRQTVFGNDPRMQSRWKFDTLRALKDSDEMRVK